MTCNITPFEHMGLSTFEQQEIRKKPYDIFDQLMGGNDIYNPVQRHQIYSQKDRRYDGVGSTDSGKFPFPKVEMLDLHKVILRRDLPALDSSVRNFTNHFSSRANFPSLSKPQSNTYSRFRPRGLAIGLLTH